MRWTFAPRVEIEIVDQKGDGEQALLVIRVDGGVAVRHFLGQEAHEAIVEAITQAGGKVNEVVGPLPDGSGFMTASFPLPKDHWIYEETGEPPMPFRRGTIDPGRDTMADEIRACAKYAIKASTMSGKDMDFDPDAMIQNLIVGMLGYWTPDGFRHT